MSRSLSKSSGQLSFPCAEIPEFAAYRQQMFVKTALLEETNGEREAFVARAMQTLDACVLGAPSREVGADKQLLKRLYHKGYARDDILRALAEAWYDESDTFSLPRRRFSALLDSGWFLWGLPLVLALFVLLELIDLLRHHYPGQAGLALWFAPVLGMLGFAIAAVLHGLIKGVIAVLERLAGAGRQAQSPARRGHCECRDRNPHLPASGIGERQPVRATAPDRDLPNRTAARKHPAARARTRTTADVRNACDFSRTTTGVSHVSIRRRCQPSYSQQRRAAHSVRAERTGQFRAGGWHPDPAREPGGCRDQ